MNEGLIYFIVAFVAFIDYKKYTQYQVLKLVPGLLEQGGKIVDVRTEDEFASAHKDGSINIPLGSLENRMKELNKKKPIILCCASGSRSGGAKRTLQANGFTNVHNAGGWRSLSKF